jgi:hypothetical protein
MFHIHTCAQNTSTSFTLFIYPPLSTCIFPSSDLFYIPVLHKCLLVVSGILSWYFTLLYFNNLTPSVILPYPFPSPVLFCSFQHVLLCLVLTQMWCISILLTFFYFSLSLFYSLTFEGVFSLYIQLYVYIR